MLLLAALAITSGLNLCPVYDQSGLWSLWLVSGNPQYCDAVMCSDDAGCDDVSWLCERLGGVVGGCYELGTRDNTLYSLPLDPAVGETLFVRFE